MAFSYVVRNDRGELERTDRWQDARELPVMIRLTIGRHRNAQEPLIVTAAPAVDGRFGCGQDRQGGDCAMRIPDGSEEPGPAPNPTRPGATGPQQTPSGQTGPGKNAGPPPGGAIDG